MTEQKVTHLLCLGMGGNQPVSSCVPNPCHPGVKCEEKLDGPECGPCPDGMQGNGTHCTDVDEVQKHDILNVKQGFCFIFVSLLTSFVTK